MENPATWGEAERIVNDAWTRWHDDVTGKMVIGLSLARTITDALRKAGLLREEA